MKSCRHAPVDRTAGAATDQKLRRRDSEQDEGVATVLLGRAGAGVLVDEVNRNFGAESRERVDRRFPVGSDERVSQQFAGAFGKHGVGGIVGEACERGARLREQGGTPGRVRE